MEHATSQKNSNQAPRAALVRLTRGTSTKQSWVLHDRAQASTLTIGSDPSCDWHVEAAGLAGHALSLALIEGELVIASGARAEAQLDGEPLAEVWQRIDADATVVVGEAEFAISREPERELQASGSERDRPTFTEGLRMSAARDSEQGMWVGRLSHSGLLDTPTLLGRMAESRGGSMVWRYGGMLVFTALAYRAWLLLLDNM